MPKQKIQAICCAVIAALAWAPLPAFADPDSAFFSESMLEQQDRQEREAQPGGAWNSAKVNVPSYVRSATDSYGTPIPGLDAVTAGQGVVTNQGVPIVATANAATQAALTGQGGVLGAATGSGGGPAAGFSGASTAAAATGAALGVLKAIP
jgi:hypothetical protein